MSIMAVLLKWIQYGREWTRVSTMSSKTWAQSATGAARTPRIRQISRNDHADAGDARYGSGFERQ